MIRANNAIEYVIVILYGLIAIIIGLLAYLVYTTSILFALTITLITISLFIPTLLKSYKQRVLPIGINYLHVIAISTLLVAPAIISYTIGDTLIYGILYVLIIFFSAYVISLRLLSMISTNIQLFVLLFFTIINAFTIMSLSYAIWVALGKPSYCTYTLLFMITLLIFTAITLPSKRGRGNVALSISVYDLAIITMSVPLMVVSVVLATSYNFGGIYWDDIYRYGLILNKYTYLGPTLRSPYIMLLTFHGTLMKLFNISYIESYALSSWINILQPLSIAFFAYALFYLLEESLSTERPLRAALYVLLFVAYANNLLLPFVMFIFRQEGIFSIANYVDPQMFKLIYGNFIDVFITAKFGIPGLIPHMLWIKTGGLGLTYLFASLGLLALLAKTTCLGRRGLIGLGAVFLYLLFSLYSSNIVLASSLSILILYLLHSFTKSCTRIRGVVVILALIAVLLLLEYMFKFMLTNTAVISALYLVSAFTYGGVVWIALTSCTLIILSLIRRIVLYYAKKYIIYRVNVKYFLIIISAISLVLLIASTTLLGLNIQNINYSHMWRYMVILPFYLIFLRSLAIPSILIVLFLLILRPSRINSGDKLLSNVVKIFLLMVLGIFLTTLLGLIFQKVSYIIVTRSLTYLLIPFSFITSCILVVVKPNSKLNSINGVLIALTIIALIPTFYCIEGYYLGGELGGEKTYSSVSDILDRMYRASNDTLITIATISKDTSSIIASLSKPNTMVLELSPSIRALTNTYSLPWYAYVISNTYDVASAYLTLSNLNVDYIVVRSDEARRLPIEYPVLYPIVSVGEISSNLFILSKTVSAEYYIPVEENKNCIALDVKVYSWLLHNGIVPAWTRYLDVNNMSHSPIILPSMIVCDRMSIENKNLTNTLYATLRLKDIKPIKHEAFLDVNDTGYILEVSYNPEKPFIGKDEYGFYLEVYSNCSCNGMNNCSLACLVYVIIEDYDNKSYEKISVSILNQDISSTFVMKDVLPSDGELHNGTNAVFIFNLTNIGNNTIALKISGKTSPKPTNLAMKVKILLMRLDKEVVKKTSMAVNLLEEHHKLYEYLEKIYDVLVPSPLNSVLLPQEKIHYLTRLITNIANN